MSLELQGAREYLKAFAVRLNTVLDNVDYLYRRLEVADQAIDVFDQAEQLVRQGLDAVPAVDFTFDRARLDRERRAEQDGTQAELDKARLAHCAKSAPPVQPAAAANQAPARKPAAKAQKAAGIPAKNGRPPSPDVAAAHAEIDRKILACMTAAGFPVPSVTIGKKVNLGRWAVKDSLRRLRAAGRVALDGSRTKARWYLIAASTKKGIAAAGPGRTLNGVEFESRWNGRKDDPSLIGDRPSRSSLP